jgi:hypothetical protein
LVTVTGKSHRSVRLISLWVRPVDEILSRAGIFQGVEPSAVSALTKQFQRVDFPRGHTVFGQGEPGDRLYIIVSGQVKIGIRSSGPAAAPADRKVPGTVSGSKHGRLSPISRSTTNRVPRPIGCLPSARRFGSRRRTRSLKRPAAVAARSPPRATQSASACHSARRTVRPVHPRLRDPAQRVAAARRDPAADAEIAM